VLIRLAITVLRLHASPIYLSNLDILQSRPFLWVVTKRLAPFWMQFMMKLSAFLSVQLRYMFLCTIKITLNFGGGTGS